MDRPNLPSGPTKGLHQIEAIEGKFLYWGKCFCVIENPKFHEWYSCRDFFCHICDSIIPPRNGKYSWPNCSKVLLVTRRENALAKILIDHGTQIKCSNHNTWWTHYWTKWNKIIWVDWYDGHRALSWRRQTCYELITKIRAAHKAHSRKIKHIVLTLGPQIFNLQVLKDFIQLKFNELSFRAYPMNFLSLLSYLESTVKLIFFLKYDKESSRMVGMYN